MKLIAAIMLVAMFFVVGASAQTQVITEGKFTSQYIGGIKRSRTEDRKETTTVRYYVGKSNDGAVETVEFAVPDMQHAIQTSVSGGVPKRSESIVIGKDFYCKVEGGKWVKNQLFCYSSPARQMAGNISSTEYTSGKLKVKGEIYDTVTCRHIWKDQMRPDAKNEENSYFIQTIWIDAKGRISLDSIEAGIVGGKKPTWSYKVEYSYGPVSKIEAPIK